MATYGICCVLVVMLCMCQLSAVAGFGYSLPEQKRWQIKFPACGFLKQSPIAIHSRQAVPRAIPAIEMVGYHNLLPGPLEIHNNGHSVSLSVPQAARANGTGQRLPYIFGGLLQNEYELEGLHFHWGSKNDRGSEHVINDMRYPLEMHIIHRNMRYKTMADALKYSDGLCVLGFVYQISEHSSRGLREIMHHMHALEAFNSKVHMSSTFALGSMLGTLDTDRLFMYKGSLTTPPCAEVVSWVVFSDTLPVTRSQMNKFRRLINGRDELLVNNYRALQPLRGRQVYVRSTNVLHTDLDDVQESFEIQDNDW